MGYTELHGAWGEHAAVEKWQHRSVRLTERSAGGWDRLCTRHNVTFTALLEAFGQLIAEGDDSPTVDAAIALAQEIDRDRRSRR